MNGVATATATNNLIGTMVVGATTSPVLTVNNAASYTIVLGAASQVTITTSGSTAGGGSRTLTGTIQDAGGNTVTTDNTTQVTFNKNSGTGTATFPGAATAVNGVATATATNKLIGTMVVGATTSPVLTVNNAASYTIVLGASSQTVFTTSPANTAGGTAFAAQPVVKVEDAGGNVITTDNATQITLTIGTNPSGGTLSGCTTNPITVASGVATFAGCKIDKAGVGYTLTTTNTAALANGVSSAFNITVGAATQVTLTTSGSTAGGGSRTLTATVQDAGGNTVTTDNTTQVTFNKNSGTGTATFPGAATAVNGVATATATNNLIGTMVVGATTSPVLTVNNAASYTIVLGAASQTVFTTSPGNTNGGTAFAAQPVVKVEDAGGNVITTDNATLITLAVGNNPSGGTLSNCTTNPVAVTAGVATFAACKLDKAGVGYTLTTTNGSGLNNGFSSAFNITVGPATQTIFTTSPANTAGGTAFAAQPVVKVEDAGGNVVATDNTTQVTLAIGTNPSGGTLSGCTTNPITVASGVATFAGCKIDKAGNGYTLTTTNTAALANGTSNSFNITVGAATQVTLTTSGSTAGGGSRTLTATIQDAGGNTVTTDNTTQVTFNKASGTGTATFPGAATAVNGVATATATNNLIGTMVVGATTSPVLTVNNAASYTIVLGAASQVSLTTSGSTAGGGSRTLTATVQDAGGNTVTTDNTTQVTFNKNSGTGTATFPGAATAVNGVATATATNKLIGTMIVGATTSPVLTVNNAASYTIVLGASSQTVFTTSPANTGGGTAFAAQPVVKVEDAGGNVITTDNTTAVTLTIGTNPSGGTLSGCTTNPITVGSGVATFAGCKINTAGVGYTLTTTNTAALANGISSSFNITVGAATQVTLTTSGSTAGGGSRTLTAHDPGRRRQHRHHRQHDPGHLQQELGHGHRDLPRRGHRRQRCRDRDRDQQPDRDDGRRRNHQPGADRQQRGELHDRLGRGLAGLAHHRRLDGRRRLTDVDRNRAGRWWQHGHDRQLDAGHLQQELGNGHRDLPRRRHRRQRRRDRDSDEQPDRDDGRRRHHLTGAHRQQRRQLHDRSGRGLAGLAHDLGLDRRRRLPHPHRNRPGRRRQHRHHRQLDAGHLQQGIGNGHRDLPRRGHRRQRCRDGDRDQQLDRDDGRRRHHLAGAHGQ